MLVKVYGAAVQGIDALQVTIEVLVDNGISFCIVGLPDAAVKESYQRVQSAMKQSSLDFPRRRVVVNMSPADIKKEGAAYDLPIAIGILAADGKLKSDSLGDYMIMGEHYTEPENSSPHYNGDTVTNERLTHYIDVVIEGMKSGRYKYLAHPDMPRADRDGHFVKEYTRLCTFMKENGFPVEVNMLGHATKRNYPCDEFMKIAAKVGNKVIIGCDAHQPSYLSDFAKQNAVRAYADSFGLEIIDTLPGLS